VKARIGQGSFGIVYKVERPGSEGAFALKILMTLQNEEVQRFLREAELARRLDHPGLVRVLDVGQHGQHPYYVMDLCEGETLRDRLRRGPLGIQESGRLVAELAQTVAAVHSRGVIHRDLKPANVILDALTGRPRLTDFGLARDSLGGKSLTQTGEGLGTPFYMAPEAFQDVKRMDNRGDVWGLGVILYECLTGRTPFTGARFEEIARAVQKGSAASPRTIRPEIGPALEAACLKAIARAPQDRHATATAFAQAIEASFAPPAPAPHRRGLLIPALALGLLVLAGGGGVLVATLLSTSRPAPVAKVEPPKPPPQPPKPKEDGRVRVRALLDEAQKLERAPGPVEEVLAKLDAAVPLAEGDLELRGAIEVAAISALRAHFRLREAIDRAKSGARMDPKSARRVKVLAALAAHKLEGQAATSEGIHAVAAEGADDAMGAYATAWCSAMDRHELDGTLLDKAIQLAPDFGPARDLKAQILLSQKRVDEALGELEEARRQDPNDPDLLWTYIDVLQETRHSAEAIEPLDRLIALEGAKPEFEVLYQRARMELHLGRSQSGFAFVDRGLQLYPGTLIGLMMRGYFAVQLGDMSRADQDFRDAAVQDFDRFEQELEGRYHDLGYVALVWSRILGVESGQRTVDYASKLVERLRGQVGTHPDFLRLEGILALRRNRPLEEVVTPWRRAGGVTDNWLAVLRAAHPECGEIDSLRARR
jgi:tetratricopeptide (TPR) repeat protein